MIFTARTLRFAARATAVAALLFGAVAARVLHSASTELEAGHAAVASGDVDLAIAHYRRAARHYVPGSPLHVRALVELETLARAAEAAGESDRALAAYRSIRGSILATRSVFVPEQVRLHAADQRIASLMAELPPPGVDAGKTKAQLRAEHLALLQASPDPHLGWTLLLLAGFVAFVGAAFAFSMRAIDAEDRLVPHEARRWGAVIVTGLSMFALGLALA